MLTICDISHFVEKITLNSMVPSVISLAGQNLEKFELKVTWALMASEKFRTFVLIFSTKRDVHA